VLKLASKQTKQPTDAHTHLKVVDKTSDLNMTVAPKNNNNNNNNNNNKNNKNQTSTEAH